MYYFIATAISALLLGYCVGILQSRVHIEEMKNDTKRAIEVTCLAWDTGAIEHLPVVVASFEKLCGE